MEANKLASRNVNVSVNIQVTNYNTKEIVLPAREIHTSRHVGVENGETGTHCRLRENMQIHNTIMQVNTIIQDKLIIPEENNTSRQGGEENEKTSTH